MSTPVQIPQPLRAIFLDLDGVMADFHRPVVELFGEDPDALDEAAWAEVGEWGLSIDKGDFWGRIQAEGAEWWSTLPKLPWADRLAAACRAACPQVIVLTTPGPFAESAAGKYQWIQDELDGMRSLIGSPKDVCSAPGHVLIDDRAGYRERWEAAGGTLLSLRRPWNPTGVSAEAIIEALEALQR